MRAFKLTVALSGVLWSLTVGVAFTGAPEVGSAYVMLSGGQNMVYPSLTEELALPLLRVDPHDPHNRPVTRAWVGLVWLVLLVSPTLASVWASRAPTREEVLSRAYLSGAVLLPVLAALVTVTVIGLALPLACL